MLAKVPKKPRAPRKKAAPKQDIKPPTFTIDIAGVDEQSFCDVFDLLVAEHAEAGVAALNPEKTAEFCLRTLEQGMTLVARDRNGKAIGTMGIVSQDLWYSDARYLQSVWLFVAPKNRRGTVGKMLLKGARAIADATNNLLLVTIDNPGRRVRKTGFVSESAGYLPVGYTLRMA